MELDALKHFKCLKEQCVQHCCIEWMVGIDPDTLENWNKQPVEVREDLFRFANNALTSDGKHWVLKKKQDGNCASLDENGLCMIQSAYGDSMQPVGCRSFPRQDHKFTTINISTATLACPEITRMVSDYNTDSLFNNEVYLDKTSILKLSDKDRVFYKVYCYMKKVIFFPEISLGIKLSIITQSTGNLVNNLEQACYDSRHFKTLFKKCFLNSEKKLLALAEQYKKHSRIEPEKFLLYWNAVMEIILQRGIKFSGIQFESSDIYLCLVADENKNQKEKSKEFRSILGSIRINKTELEQIDQLLQNFVYLTCLNHGFPLKPRYDNLLLSLAYCNVTFAITSVILVAQQQNKILTKTDVINTIWKVERMLKDSDDIYRFIAANQILLDPDQHGACIRYLFSGFTTGSGD